MSEFYFFKNDKQCQWMRNEINKMWPRYLSNPISYNDIGKKFKKTIHPYQDKKKFYIITEWVTHNKADKITDNQRLLSKELGINVVKTINDLPENSGIYVAGYDAAIDQIENATKKGIPVINNACPWIYKLKKQIYSVNPLTHQCIIMMDQQHILFNTYKVICPKDTIFILPENYKNEIINNKNDKPIHLLCYATFRVSEIERVITFINSDYPNPDNNLYGYKETMCCWTKQGIYEELRNCINEKGINKFWLIYTSVTDRSLISLINELNELNVECLKIKSKDDVPVSVKSNEKIGIIITPVPIAPSIIKSIIRLIKQRFNIQ